MSLYVDIEKRLGVFRLQSKFEVADETLALLGASGCGKSVTLKCIAGIMTPDRGRIVLDGETLFDSERRVNLPPQRRCVGYLFQQYALFPNMTVQQNILCGIRTGSRVEKQRAAAEQLRRFRLDGLEKRYPSQLSGGQAQRVALARILASQPRAILLDEPFSALDSYLKWNLELELSELLADFGGPILWVSHDLGECCRNCRRVCVMEQGRSGEMTDMAALVRRPTTLGTAKLAGCRNFFPVRAVEGGVLVEDWGLTLPLTAAQERATLAIPDGAIKIGTGDLACTVRRIIPDLGCSTVLLQPDGAAADSPPLLTALPEGLKLREGERTTCALQPEQLLLF